MKLKKRIKKDVGQLMKTLTSLAISSERKVVDGFVLCELCSKLGYKIQIEEAPDLPRSVPATRVKIKDRNWILYRPSDSVVSVQISVLHELFHVLLDNSKTTYHDIQNTKSFYTDKVEAENERLASILLSRLAFPPKEKWWEKILKGQIALSYSSSTVKRFMELMNGDTLYAKNSHSRFHIARIKQVLP